MGRLFFLTCFRLFGWRIEGDLRPNLKKCVLIIAPHTSNWDFVIGVAARTILRFRANYLIKKEVYKNGLLTWFFNYTGGIPVDRKDKKVDLVDSVVEQFDRRGSMVLTITPEGTRSYVPEWKTGFYRIAHRAKVPIVMVGFDYSRKLVKFLGELEPTGDMDGEIAKIRSLYQDVKGKHPELGVH